MSIDKTESNNISYYDSNAINQTSNRTHLIYSEKNLNDI